MTVHVSQERQTEWSPTPGPGDADGLYATLGLAPGATVEEIKRAHRRAVKEWHPDLCSHAHAQERIRWINRAHEVLTDPTSRRAYDDCGHRWCTVTADRTEFAVGDVNIGVATRVTCRVTVHGSPDGGVTVDLASTAGDGWRIDIVAIADRGGATAAFDIVVEVTPNRLGSVHHEFIVSVCRHDIVLVIDGTAIPAPWSVRARRHACRGARRVALCWTSTPSRHWHRRFHQYCVVSQIGFGCASWYLVRWAEVRVASGVLDADVLDVVKIQVFALATAVIIAAVHTGGFSRGTWRAKWLAAVLALPGAFAVVAAAVFIAVVAVVAALVVAAVAIAFSASGDS